MRGIAVAAVALMAAALQKTDTRLAPMLEKAAKDGVVLAAGQNLMRARHVKSDELFPFAVEVPSGLAEVVLKQEAGFSYLKMSYDAPAK
jgi:intracellular sulfur oxidation DsrE/DsrF family protein